MKLSRIAPSLFAFAMVAALAACGGGGGGSSIPNPGGGGGPTPGPSNSPTSSPTSTPTAAPTSTPTAAPTGNTIQSNGTIAKIYDGTTSPLVFGKDDWQTNGTTDTNGGPHDGDLAGGFTSSNTGPINGVSCTLGTEPGQGQYHVHTFVGIYVNGVQYAVPDAIGMLNPSGDEPGYNTGYPNLNFSQACSMHTHSTSGIVHMEDQTLQQNFAMQPAQYNLQSLLDIWGQASLANVATATAGFAGPISVYVGTPCPNNTVGCASPQKNAATGDDLVTSYTLINAQPSGILFGHHVAIWIIAGPMPAAGLPAIDFGLVN